MIRLGNARTRTRLAGLALAAAVIAANLAGLRSSSVDTLGVSNALASPRAFVREPNIDRSGNDIRSVKLKAEAQVDDCEMLCQGTPACVAYTFVKRSTTVPQPICWLKDTIPHGYESSCCTSGSLKK